MPVRLLPVASGGLALEKEGIYLPFSIESLLKVCVSLDCGDAKGHCVVCFHGEWDREVFSVFIKKMNRCFLGQCPHRQLMSCLKCIQIIKSLGKGNSQSVEYTKKLSERV